MVPSPRLDSVELALVVVESILYGIFLVLLLEALQLVYEKRRQGQPYAFLAIGSAFFFCTITAHLILDVARDFDAFIYTSPDPSAPPGTNAAIDYFEDLTNVKYVAMSSFFVVATVVGDAFMIYRLYIVWSRAVWIVLILAVMWIPDCISGIFILVLASKHGNNGSIFNTEGGWITTIVTLTMVTNITCTLLIAYRVWLSKRSVANLRATRNTRIQRVMRAIIQSAAIYTICLILLLVFYVRKNNVQYIFAATNCPTIGIVFIMITARSERSSYGTETDSESHNLRDLRPVTINISREVTSDAGVNHVLNTKPQSLEDPPDSLNEVQKFAEVPQHSDIP